jgi:uncharacterized protein
MKRRNPTFHFADQTTRYWYDGNPFVTLFFNGMSTCFPAGELLFVQSISFFRDKIKDPQLLEAMAIFTFQEARHRKMHHEYNLQMEALGYPFIRLEAFMYRFIASTRIYSDLSRLTLTVCYEHLTTIMCETLLNNPKMVNAMASPFREAWIYHAIEELEHKAVAFDVYRAVGGGYFRRFFLMLLSTFVLFLEVSYPLIVCLHKDRILFSPSTWVQGFRFLFLTPGFLLRLVPGYLRFFLTNFHPNQHDHTALLESWSKEVA